MELLNTIIKNLNCCLSNSINLLEKPFIIFHKYFRHILNHNGYHAIFYTHNTVLILSRDINYWFEVQLYENTVFIIFCSNNKFVEIHRWYDYCTQIEKIGDELILQLNTRNDEWTKLLNYFKNHYYDTNNEHRYKYMLSVIKSLKNTYVFELITYFNKNLISIIINYLLGNV